MRIIVRSGSRLHVRFSNRPFGIKRFQTIHQFSVDAARGLVLLSGIGTKALPSYVDGGAIGQRHHGADTGDRHQAPAHVIIPDDGQQAAVQDADLLAKYLPDNE